MAALTAQPGYRAPGSPVRDGGRLVVQTWLFTRLLLVGTALWVGVTTGRSATDMLANWDVQHYFDIALDGYAAPTDVAFFPGWPLVLRAFHLVGVPLLVAGVGLAVICSALAAAALHRLGGPIAAVVWLLAPTTVFTFVPYTEAPFCAAAFWAWERARARRWGAAATLAAVACTIRVSGLFLLGALVILALTQAGQRLSASAPGWVRPAASPAPLGVAGRVRAWFDRLTARPSTASAWPSSGGSTPPPSRPLRERARAIVRDERVRALAWLTIPALVIVGYMAYLYNLTGDWNAWYHAQASGWPRGFTWPWVALQHTIEAATSKAYPAFPEWSWVFRAELVAMAIGVLVTVLCLRRKRWGEAFWVGIQVLAFSCSYWYLSVNRAVLLWFPLFILIAERLQGGWNVGPAQRRFRILLTIAGFAAASVALCWWAWLFYTGRWAS